MENKRENKITGNTGEQLACDYLQSRGYKILGRNLNYAFGEIDILAELKNMIIIVEVKTVKGSGWGGAVDLVRYKKQQKLKLLSKAVALEYPNKNLRIDVIAINNGEIDHIESAVTE